MAIDECKCGARHEELVGREDPFFYDGVCEWFCTCCHAVWDRFTGEIINEGDPENFSKKPLTASDNHDTIEEREEV